METKKEPVLTNQLFHQNLNYEKINLVTKTSLITLQYYDIIFKPPNNSPKKFIFLSRFIGLATWVPEFT